MVNEAALNAVAWFYGKGHLFEFTEFERRKENFLQSLLDSDDAEFVDAFNIAIVLLKGYFRSSIFSAYARAEKNTSLFSVVHGHGVVHAKDLFRLVGHRPVGAEALQTARDEFEDIRDSLEGDAFGQDDGVPPHRVLAAGNGIAILNDWIAFIDSLLLWPEEDDDNKRARKKQRIDTTAASIKAALIESRGDVAAAARRLSRPEF